MRRYGHGANAESGGSNATRVAIYGDMGNTAGNNMGNLRAGVSDQHARSSTSVTNTNTHRR